VRSSSSHSPSPFSLPLPLSLPLSVPLPSPLSLSPSLPPSLPPSLSPFLSASDVIAKTSEKLSATELPPSLPPFLRESPPPPPLSPSPLPSLPSPLPLELPASEPPSLPCPLEHLPVARNGACLVYSRYVPKPLGTLRDSKFPLPAGMMSSNDMRAQKFAVNFQISHQDATAEEVAAGAKNACTDRLPASQPPSLPCKPSELRTRTFENDTQLVCS
jgi:hypothetical protein